MDAPCNAGFGTGRGLWITDPRPDSASVRAQSAGKDSPFITVAKATRHVPEHRLSPGRSPIDYFALHDRAERAAGAESVRDGDR